MKKFAAALLGLTAAAFLHAEEPVCHHCEEIREYNAAHHQNYEYYEDYLKTPQKAPETDTKTTDVKKTSETDEKK